MSRLYVLFLFLLTIVIPRIAAAQYMYLDANGDGLSSSADLVNPSGSTTFDIWIRTNTNRDGSAATCVTEDGDLTINSYEFILHATGGTLSWSGFANHQPDFNVNLGHAESATDYHNGFGGGTILPPGTYRLASLTVTVTLGSPSIGFASATPLSGVFLTSFGSRCSGNDFDNTLKLGSDWFDTDGAPYGGAANQPPVLIPPSEMTLAEGTVAEQELLASDPEGQPITFGLVSGPEYATVTTIDPGTGQARGLVRLTPGLREGGVTSATVRASDGLLEDTGSFTITVTDVNTAPSLEPIPDIFVTEGDIRTLNLAATDAEGDPLTFTRLTGPSFVTVSNVGLATGRLTVAPLFADAGEVNVTVQVSDGVLTDTATFHLTVGERFAVHNQILCPLSDMLVPPGAIQEQQVHAVSPDGNPVQFLLVSGPAFVTVTSVSSDPANARGVVRAAPGASDVGSFEVTVAATDGVATDSKTFTVAVGDSRALPDPAHPLFQGHNLTYAVGGLPQGAATADLDGDDILDIVTANLLGSVTILRGRPDGAFDRRDDYPLGEEPYSVAIGDVNEDGRPDLAVADSGLSIVSILLSIGECQFGRRIDVGTPNKPAHVKLADFDADGNLDMVVSNEGAHMVSLHRGKGDGTFFDHTHYPVGLDPCYADDGDFNGDGHLDVVVANERSDNLSVLLGNGDGTLQPHVVYAVGDEPRSVEVGDFNGDGKLDLAAANFDGFTVSVLLGAGDGTFLPHTEYPCGRSPWSAAVGDLNRDGHLDIVTANVGDNTTSILLGNGSGAFPTQTVHPSGGEWTRYVVLGDADRDGSTDLIVANEASSTVTVALGRGDGGFLGPATYPTGENPSTAISGDWNGDGNTDLAIGRGLDAGEVQILLGTGGGAFQPGTPIPGLLPTAMVAGDWDEDGALDLAVVSRNPSRVSVLKGGGNGTFGSPVDHVMPGIGFSIIATPLVGGPLDLVYAVSDPPGLLILDGSGDGSFVPREPVALSGRPTQVVSGDWNGDGLTDFAVSAIVSNQVHVLLGAADGSVAPGSPIRLDEAPLGIAAADLNGDGVADLALALTPNPLFFPIGGDEGTLEIRHGLGDATFGPPRTLEAEPVPGWVRALDVNGDGRTDLAVHSGISATLSLIHGLGNGDFAPKSDFGSGGLVVEAAELSGDGRVDFVSVEPLHRAGIWINRGTFPVGTNRPPVASPGGPYAGAIGAAVLFDGSSSSDPDGDPLSMTWNFGDGTTGLGAEVAHTYSSEGSFPVTLTVSDGRVSDSESTTATIAASLEARAFTLPEDGAIRLFAGRPNWCVRLEPLDDVFDLSEVDLESVRLRSVGTGSVEEIGALADKSTPLLDRDRNGVVELKTCFTAEDLRLLFASVAGSRDVPVTLQGVLTDGRRFHSEATLRVIGAPGFPTAFVAPNPMNPAATLFVGTSRAGHLRASLFDAAGRRVRAIADRSMVPAGVQELRIDGRTDQGTDLPSGIYFYLVESAEGTTRGRISILK